jgi:hypothetical protein
MASPSPVLTRDLYRRFLKIQGRIFRAQLLFANRLDGPPLDIKHRPPGFERHVFDLADNQRWPRHVRHPPNNGPWPGFVSISVRRGELAGLTVRQNAFSAPERR